MSLNLVTNLNLPFSSFPINSIVFFNECVYGSRGIGSDVAAPSNIVICGDLLSIFFFACSKISSVLTKTITNDFSLNCVFNKKYLSLPLLLYTYVYCYLAVG